MLVSVIVPVYNATRFVTRAVESALEQPETTEVLLIEDGSPDNALEVCQGLDAKYDKVKLLRHTNGENRGAGASRNLGMKNAACEYIAFLDADDYFLPGRFEVAKQIFKDDPTCEGVYEAIGMHVEDEDALSRWMASGKPEHQLQTMIEKIPPDKLADALIFGGKGYFHLDGLIIKKSVLERTGLMAENLQLHQDTDFMIRLAIAGRISPGRLDVPVAKWRVHDHNRISAVRSDIRKLDDRLLMWMELYKWCKKNGQDEYQVNISPFILTNIISSKRFGKIIHKWLPRKAMRLYQLMRWLLSHPQYAFDGYFWHGLGQIIRK